MRYFVFCSMFASALFCGVGSANAEEFRYPLTCVAAQDGTIYVADRNLPGIWKVNGGKIETYFKGSKKFRTPLNAVRCVALDKNGRLLAGDSSTREVYRFDESAKPQPLTDGSIGIPMDIAVDADGTLFVTDLELHRIWKVPAEGGKPEEFVTLAAPRGITIDEQGRLWVVTHSPDHSLVRIDEEGNVEPVVKGRQFQFAHEVAVVEGTAYVTDGYAKAVWKVDADGKIEKLCEGKPFDNPVGLDWNGEHLIVVDPRANAVFQVTLSGEVTQIAPPPQ